MLVLFITCQKEKITLREYPRIEISDEIIQKESGVTFKANIITEGNSAIINKGFVWNSGNNIPTIDNHKIIIEENLTIGEFNAVSSFNIQANTMYSVRAFVQTEKYIVYSRIIQFESKFESLHSRWTKMNDFPGQARKLAIGFSYNGKGYYGLGIHPNGYDEGAYTDLWEYDKNWDKWIQKTSFPGFGRERPSCFQINEMFYVCAGRSNINLSEVWRYDAENDVWTQMNDFPGTIGTGAIEFSIGSKGYIGWGEYDLWEYDPDSDTWDQRAIKRNPENFHDDNLSLSLGNFGYVFVDYKRGYRYSPDTETWEQINNLPVSINQGTGFIINNILYFGIGLNYLSIVGYNPENGLWSSFPYKGGETLEASSFVIDDKAYIVGGWYYTSYAPYWIGRKDVWQFDPSY